MRTVSDAMKERFGCKVYRLSLDIGCTCPNRDGTKGVGGCIFCSEGGSGDFAEKLISPSEVETALEEAKKRVINKIGNGMEVKFIAYFQSFTNTYGDVKRLKEIFTSAAKVKDVVALSIGTRPDCIGEAVLEMLLEVQKIKPVWIEFGLQTIHEKTAKLINRCYELSEFESSYNLLKEKGFEIIIHLILGLPNESLIDMEASVEYVKGLSPKPDGIKLQLLHVLKNTVLASMVENGEVDCYDFSLEEYAAFVGSLLRDIPDEIVVHRMTGDAPKKLLISPLWSGDKKRVLNTINAHLRKQT